MKAIMATLMIALAVCFTGCDKGDDAAAPESEGDTTEEPERRRE